MKKGILPITKEQNLPMREKYWSELTDAEKVERLREYAHRVERLTERMGEFEYLIKNHKHLDGVIVTEVKSSQMEKGGVINHCYNCEKCRSEVMI